jgi:hypothetical protein
MSCCRRLAEFFKKGVKNKTTGSFLNYYTLHITDMEIRKKLNDKWIENFNSLFWLVLPLQIIGLLFAILSYL